MKTRLRERERGSSGARGVKGHGKGRGCRGQTGCSWAPRPLGRSYGDEAHHKFLVCFCHLDVCLSVLPCSMQQSCQHELMVPLQSGRLLLCECTQSLNLTFSQHHAYVSTSAPAHELPSQLMRCFLNCGALHERFHHTLTVEGVDS